MTDPRPPARYTERYVVPWWFWPLGLLAVLGFGAMFDGPISVGVPAWPVYLVLAVLLVVALLLIGRVRVTVTADELRADDARLPLRHVAHARPLDPAARRRLLGVDAHPYAFIIQRPWIAGSVRITLDDPDDPTPYWILSSRHPQRLAAALNAGRSADPDADAGPDRADPRGDEAAADPEASEASGR